MPSQIGVSMGITLPTVGGDFGVWGAAVNVILQAFQDAIEAGVSSEAGLTITADVNIGGFDFTDVGAIYFRDKDAAFAPASVIYERDGELYFNDASANQVKITAGGSINAAGVAGIGGDYGGSDPASVVYNDATSKYIFTTDPNIPASMDVGSLIIGRTGETSPNKVTLQCPVALAGAYTLTLPATLPASATSFLQVSTAGVISATLTPSATSLTLSGGLTSATVSTGVLIAGATAVTSLTASSHVTTAEAGIRHASTIIAIPPSGMIGTTTGDAILTTVGWTATLAGSLVRFPVIVPVSSRITAVGCYMTQGSSGDSSLTLRRIDSLGAGSTIGTNASSGAADIILSISGLTTTVSSGHCYEAEFNFGTNSIPSAKIIQGFVIYDKVA
jgi:hypothetical protein